jgi:hypothetical protein
MEGFRRETKAIVRRFLEQQITLEECESALGNALLAVSLRLGPGQTDNLEAVMKANNETVRDEVERRAGRSRGRLRRRNPDALARDFVEKMDLGHLDGRLSGEISKLSTEQLEKVAQIVRARDEAAGHHKHKSR